MRFIKSNILFRPPAFNQSKQLNEISYHSVSAEVLIRWAKKLRLLFLEAFPSISRGDKKSY